MSILHDPQEYVSHLSAVWCEAYWREGREWQAEIVRRLQDLELSLIVCQLSGEPVASHDEVRERCSHIVNSLRQDTPTTSGGTPL